VASLLRGKPALTTEGKGIVPMGGEDCRRQFLLSKRVYLLKKARLLVVQGGMSKVSRPSRAMGEWWPLSLHKKEKQASLPAKNFKIGRRDGGGTGFSSGGAG